MHALSSKACRSDAEVMRMVKQLYDQAMQAAPDPSLVDVMALSTCGVSGVPTIRNVYCRLIDEEGLVFYTNYQSQKSEDLRHQSRLSCLFFWPWIQRQIVVQGVATVLSREASCAYFSGRSRERQISAWASQQSSPMDDYETLLRRYQHWAEYFEDQPIPCPDYWGGYRINPYAVECLAFSEERLHKRIIYQRQSQQDWVCTYLAP